MFKISFYAPASHVEAIKESLFLQGAGKIGDYSCCAWQTLGEGQFMPLEGSHAFVGKIGSCEKVPEYKVEMVCEDQYIQNVIKALKENHPYEQPAVDVIRMETI